MSIQQMAKLIVLAAVAAGLCSCGKQTATEKTASHKPSPAKPPLLCYVGGTMRPAMKELVSAYGKKTGQRVEVDYADSGELLVKIEQTGLGDLYVAHDPFIAGLMKKGLGNRAWTTATLTPVVAVPKGNPKGIRGFRDLARPGLRVILTDEQYSTGGHVVARMAAKAGVTQSLNSNTISRTRSGGEAANAVILGTADAAIVWNAVVKAREDKLDAVPLEDDVRLIKGVDAVTSATYGVIDMDYIRVGIATLKSSKQSEAAAAFAEFVASPTNSAIWNKYGFSPVDPSREPAAVSVSSSLPDEHGSLLVLCAAGMRLPVETMAREFEKKTGTKVSLSFDGSNRLLGQIKLTGKGDVYVAGDAEYVDMAAKEGLVANRSVICHFVPVILVQKNNPKQVKSLADLAKAGTRIGQGDEKAAAVGRIMPQLLELNGVDTAAWKSNVVMITPTVTELGIGIKLGTVDAVVVWDGVAAAYTDVGEIIRLEPAKNVYPAVEAAVLKMATNQRGAEAFLAFMASEDGKRILKASGYTLEKP